MVDPVDFHIPHVEMGVKLENPGKNHNFPPKEIAYSVTNWHNVIVIFPP